ncbi:hypothetical protein C2845_PM01G19900 [Panicum miliaceum]|uniref:POX domain-containing protein n=1 Tax=Panicum miliaceum TaxID=4540 RepID=A0A3L6TLS7_PANMI|nr:hypothetical protein C2845_PM01G19900 [Panicum miliaceum]
MALRSPRREGASSPAADADARVSCNPLPFSFLVPRNKAAVGAREPQRVQLQLTASQLAPRRLAAERMAHDPSLAYADYFAAAGGVSTLVPEVDAGEDESHLYGDVHAHHHGLDMFGARGLVPGATVVAAAHGKGAALGDFALGAEHHGLLGHSQAPLTSLSLHGPAEAASLALHHHQLGGGGALRQHQPAVWPPPPQQQGGAWHLRGSRFLRPTQQLLQEFCGLPVEAASKQPTKPGSEDGAGEGSSSSAPSAQIQAMDAAELQRLKAKLYAMLQEVVLSNARHSPRLD